MPRSALLRMAALEEELRTAKRNGAKRDEYTQALQRNCETLAALCAKHMSQVRLLHSSLRSALQAKYELESIGQMNETNATLAAQLTQANRDLELDRARQSATIDELNTKLYSVQTQLSEMSEGRDELAAGLLRERAMVTSLRAEVEELKGILMAADARHAAAQKKASTATHNRVGSGNGSEIGAHHDLQRNLRDMRSEFESNQAALSDLQQRHAQLQAMHTRQGNVAAQVRTERDMLKADVQRLKKQCAQLRQQAEEATQRAQMREEESNKLRSEHDGLSKEAHKLRARVPLLEDRLRQSERSRDHLKRQYEGVWSEKEDLLLQLDELRAVNELQTKQMAIMTEQKQDEAGKDTTTAVPPASVDELPRLQSTIDSLQAQLAEMQKRLDACEAELNTAVQSSKEWQEKYELIMREKGALADELKSTKATEQQRVDGERGNMDSLQAELAALKQSLSAAQSDIEHHASDARELRAQLTAQSDASNVSLSSLRAELESSWQSRVREYEQQVSSMQKQLLQTQRELDELRDQPRLTAADVARLTKQQQELHACVAKLIINEDASEASFTCIACLNVFDKPVTCIPCGHSYCLKCIEKTNNTCTQCRPPAQVTYYANDLLADLASRFVVRKQALATIREMTKQNVIPPTRAAS